MQNNVKNAQLTTKYPKYVTSARKKTISLLNVVKAIIQNLKESHRDRQGHK